MLHVKLGDRSDPPANDPMGRSWIGYDPTVSLRELWEINRGRWKISRQAAREGHVIFSHNGEVKFIAEIHGLEESTEGRRIIVGRLLDEDEPLARRWIGAPAPGAGNRNPVHYFTDERDGTLQCACGCGAPVTKARAFLPGHDQRAIHARIVEAWGDTLGFMDWFDAHRAELVDAAR